MEITVGSIWRNKANDFNAEVMFVDNNNVIYKDFELSKEFIMNIPTFKDGFMANDTGDDIAIGSCWSYCGSIEVEVINVAVDDEGDVIVTHEDKDGELDYDTVAYFRENYTPVFGADNVNSPSHYNEGQVECIDAIRAALTDEEFRGFCKGNVLKYTWREKHKGGNESLEKAVWYLKQMVGE